MEISLIAAKILGIYFVISGLFLMFKGKTLPALLKDLFDHPAITYVIGIVLVFLSTIFLIQADVWDGTWRSIVTILMWLILFKGLAWIFIPEKLHKLVTKKFLDTVNLYGLVMVVVGLFLFSIG